ncbi:MAG: hypothetical protein WCI53_08070 [Bacteroidota bacterium]|jgi:hypothetical protein
MRTVIYDKINEVEIEDWGQFFKTIIAIETLKPSTQIETNSHIIDQLFESRKDLDLPFDIKQTKNENDFQERLKLSFLTIKHKNFKLRLSIFNSIGKEKNFIIGGILKILAKHSPDYNKFEEYKYPLFDNLIVPDIINEICSCRFVDGLVKPKGEIIYINNQYKLVTKKIINDIEDIISFYPFKIIS